MDWHAAYAAKMSIAADAILENVLTRTGVKTESVPLIKGLATALSVI